MTSHGPAPEDQPLADGVAAGDRRALARAITLAESTRDDHRVRAERLITSVLDRTGRSVRLGVTGSPGVGKSTFIDAFGRHLLADGRRLAVLAVDPSSTTTGGSILGDKTRMGSLTSDLDDPDQVFVRPSPSGGITGGVANRTRDAVLLCEAAGYDTVVVETVGVGQSETAVATITDLFVLLVTPGGGDDLQGIKRGVMELADLLVVNKADGPMAELALTTVADYQLALHLVRPKWPDLATEVVACSSLERTGIDDVADRLFALHRSLEQSGRLSELRAGQSVEQLRAELRSLLVRRAADHPRFDTERRRLEAEVADRRVSVSDAARRLLDLVWTQD